MSDTKPKPKAKAKNGNARNGRMPVVEPVKLKAPRARQIRKAIPKKRDARVNKKHNNPAALAETKAVAIERKKRNKKILDLRIAGASEQTIADEVGCSDTTVHRVLHEIIEEMNIKLYIKADVLKRMELERLDKITLALFANRNDPRTADTLLRVMERRSKYLGLDVPMQSEVVTKQEGPIEVKHDLTKLSLEELKSLRSIVAKTEGAADDDPDSI